MHRYQSNRSPTAVFAVIDTSPQRRRQTSEMLESFGLRSLEIEKPEDLQGLIGSSLSIDAVLMASESANSKFLNEIQALDQSSLPPLLLLLQEEQMDVARCLSAGFSGDFIRTPFDANELKIRLHAFSERPKPLIFDGDANFGYYRFHPGHDEIEVRGQHIKLPPQEFKLALFFFRNPGKPHSRESLYKLLWNDEKLATRTLEVHIARIRRRLGITPQEGHFELRCIRGRGYQLTIGT